MLALQYERESKSEVDMRYLPSLETPRNPTTMTTINQNAPHRSELGSQPPNHGDSNVRPGMESNGAPRRQRTKTAKARDNERAL